jgi:uncharacterized protein YcfL
MRIVLILLVAAFSLTGCAVQRAILHNGIRNQVAFAEGCPVERVKVLDSDGPIARVSVCGRVKLCRWSADASAWVCR